MATAAAAAPAPLHPGRMKALYRHIQTRKSAIWGDWARPDRPTSVEFQIAQHGGQSSAIDLLPCRLKWSKKEPGPKEDQVIHAVYEASYLRAENAYYRKIRRAAVLFEYDVATALLGQESLPVLRDCLYHLEHGSERPRHRLSQARGTSRLRTAVDDFSVAVDRLTTSYDRLQQAHKEFRDALKKIDQEYADFFSVTLSDKLPGF